MLSLANADRHFLLCGLRCIPQCVKRILSQVSKNGDQTAHRKILSVSMQLTRRVEHKPDAQLCRTIRLADQQRRNRRLPNTLRNIADRVRTRLRQMQHILLRLLVLAQLQQTEDHMQLVGKLMRIRPQRTDYVLHAGQILRQPRDLGPVAENSDNTLHLAVPPERHTVGNDRNMLDGLQTDVVFAFAGLQHARHR